MKRGESGQIGGVEAAVFGVLIFVMGTLIVANAWGVVDAKLATSGAAREVARAIVESGDPGRAAASADEVAARTLEAHGRDRRRMDAVVVEGGLLRCQRITVEVRYRVPFLALPLLGSHGSAFTVVGRHSEIVDPFRSGLPGEARCG